MHVGQNVTASHAVLANVCRALFSMQRATTKVEWRHIRRHCARIQKSLHRSEEPTGNDADGTHSVGSTYHYHRQVWESHDLACQTQGHEDGMLPVPKGCGKHCHGEECDQRPELHVL